MLGVCLLLQEVGYVCTMVQFMELRSKALDEVKAPPMLRIVTLAKAY
jgi:hypothetical protein